jgi:Haem-NO-binding
MHGLFFVTWEKYLAERFGTSLLNTYRKMMGESPTHAPLASRVYDDETLLAGVGVAYQLTQQPVETILREYGRYFILNGLTSHLCAYLLTQVRSGKELLMVMRDAHAQMRRTPDSLTPPLFQYELSPLDANGFILVYDSPRQLCSVLHGAIEGAALRYGEKVQIHEQTCMKKGAPTCRFEVHFFAPASGPLMQQETPEQRERRTAQRQLAQLVLAVLPSRDGVSLQELQGILTHHKATAQQIRPSVLLEALRHLQHTGLVASTANQPGDDLTCRRYWRTPTS